MRWGSFRKSDERAAKLRSEEIEKRRQVEGYFKVVNQISDEIIIAFAKPVERHSEEEISHLIKVATNTFDQVAMELEQMKPFPRIELYDKIQKHNDLFHLIFPYFKSHPDFMTAYWRLKSVLREKHKELDPESYIIEPALGIRFVVELRREAKRSRKPRVNRLGNMIDGQRSNIIDLHIPEMNEGVAEERLVESMEANLKAMIENIKELNKLGVAMVFHDDAWIEETATKYESLRELTNQLKVLLAGNKWKYDEADNGR